MYLSFELGFISAGIITARRYQKNFFAEFSANSEEVL
jgi:hypothetical protein